MPGGSGSRWGWLMLVELSLEEALFDASAGVPQDFEVVGPLDVDAVQGRSDLFPVPVQREQESFVGPAVEAVAVVDEQDSSSQLEDFPLGSGAGLGDGEDHDLGHGLRVRPFGRPGQGQGAGHA